MAITVQMKHLIAVCVIFMTCAFQAMSRTLYDPSVVEAHKQWMLKYGRTYSDEAEYEKRLHIFKQKLDYIEKFNKGGKKSYTVGLNPFSDLTTEEFLSTHTGLMIETDNSSKMAASAVPLTQPFVSGLSLGWDLTHLARSAHRLVVRAADRAGLWLTKRSRSQKSLARTHGFRKRMSTTDGRDKVLCTKTHPNSGQ